VTTEVLRLTARTEGQREKKRRKPSPIYWWGFLILGRGGGICTWGGDLLCTGNSDREKGQHRGNIFENGGNTLRQAIAWGERGSGKEHFLQTNWSRWR